VGGLTKYEKHEAVSEFESWSQNYDDSIVQRLLFVPSHNAMLERLLAHPPRRVLDIGGGTGVFALRAAHLFPEAEVWVLDLSIHMLSEGLHRLSDTKQLHYVQADSEHLPFADDSFDAITCANSFHHYPHQAVAIGEMHRVLRPGGRLVIVDGYRDSLWGRFIFDICVVAAEGKVNHLSGKAFVSIFEQGGFTEVRQHASGFRLAPFVLTEGMAHKPATGKVGSEPQVA